MVTVLAFSTCSNSLLVWAEIVLDLVFGEVNFLQTSPAIAFNVFEFLVPDFRCPLVEVGTLDEIGLMGSAAEGAVLRLLSFDLSAVCSRFWFWFHLFFKESVVGYPPEGFIGFCSKLEEVVSPELLIIIVCVENWCLLVRGGDLC